MIHKTDSGSYGISSHNVWLPGSYDSRRTANYAFRFPNDVLETLQESVNPGGMITYEMLKSWNTGDSKMNEPRFTGAGQLPKSELGDKIEWSRHTPRYFGWKIWRWGKPTLKITSIPQGYRVGDVVKFDYTRETK